MKELRYSYPIDALFAGASLGNPTAWATLSPLSDLKGLWNAADNRYYVGEWIMTLAAEDVILEPTGSVFTPGAQSTMLSGGHLRVEKTLFIPFAPVERAGPVPSFCKSAIMLVRIVNDGADEKEVTCRHTLVFPPVANELFTKQPPQREREARVSVRDEQGACIVTTEGLPTQVRVFGSAIPWKKFRFDEKTVEVEYEVTVQGGGGVREEAYVLAFSEEGREAARKTFDQCQDGRMLLKKSAEAYAEVLSRTEIITPEPVINRGLQWAKVNSVRVQHRYRGGLAFTNDPPQDIVVIRDLGWYVFGADYVTPDFCEGLLNFGEQYGYHEGGKLTEYLHADEVSPEQHDYKLNINDDTPLFVAALYHHAVACLNDEHLGRVYGLMRKAAEWILSQVSDGLVRCSSSGTSVWGICSWRNIIEGYNLAGAVTEINAECYHALLLTGKVARKLGQLDDAERYSSAAKALKNAMNTRLVSERTGLYVLNLDNEGMPHHDVTGDLIFPVLFDVATPERAEAILKTLTTPEMWTSWGARTVHPMEPLYDPEFGYQLVGGVWPNLTAWISYCLRKNEPEKMVEGMVNIFAISEAKTPVEGGRITPGEFPERFHGEKRVSLGMSLSPWTPPTYLWLGVEGLLGVAPTLSGLELDPSIPASWEWVAVKNLLYRGERLDAFLFGGTLYSTREVTTHFPLQVGIPVKTMVQGDDIAAIAMRMGMETILFACSDSGGTGTVEMEIGSTAIKKVISLEKGGASLIRLGAI